MLPTIDCPTKNKISRTPIFTNWLLFDSANCNLVNKIRLLSILQKQNLPKRSTILSVHPRQSQDCVRPSLYSRRYGLHWVRTQTILVSVCGSSYLSFHSIVVAFNVLGDALDCPRLIAGDFDGPEVARFSSPMASSGLGTSGRRHSMCHISCQVQ